MDGDGDAVEKRRDVVCRDQHRRRVEHHDVTPRPTLTVEDGSDGVRIGGRVRALHGVERRRLEADVARVEEEIANAFGGHLVATRGAANAELIDAVGSGEHQRMGVSQSMQHLGHDWREARVRNTEQLVANPSGVGERTDHVEHGPNPELATHRTDMAQRRVKIGRIQEADAGLGDTAAHAVGRKRDHDFKCLEHVRAAALRRRRAIAMLRHRASGTRGDQRGGR